MKQKIKTGILMTALAVGSLHIVNRCAQAFATVKNLLDKHKGAFYDWRFGQVYYTKTGSGSPLLLVHDLAPAASSYEWDLLRPTGTQTNAESGETKRITCPGCGAPLDVNASARCPYCGTVIRQQAQDWVISAIRGIKQQTL